MIMQSARLNTSVLSVTTVKIIQLLVVSASALILTLVERDALAIMVTVLTSRGVMEPTALDTEMVLIGYIRLLSDSSLVTELAQDLLIVSADLETQDPSRSKHIVLLTTMAKIKQLLVSSEKG